MEESEKLGNIDSGEPTSFDEPKAMKETQRVVADASCQTDFVVIDVDLPELKRRMSAASNTIQEALTAESIAATAQSVLNKSGWVYDQRTGTYFDYTTNLYYYPQTRLYYNYKNGCYYKYDQDTQKYVFHYQLESFRGKGQQFPKQNGKNAKKKEKQSFPTLKKLELTYSTNSRQRSSNGEAHNVTEDAMITSSAEIYHGLYTQRLNALVSNAENKACTQEHLSDSENMCMSKKTRKYLFCQKCSNLTTSYCCQSARQRFSSRQKLKECRGYFSDSESEILSATRTKYIQCQTCKSLALSACCEKVTFWLDKTALSKPIKRKRGGRKKKRKRRRRCTQSSDSSLTEKENGTSSSAKNSDTSSSQDEEKSNLCPTKGTFEGSKVEYSFNQEVHDIEFEPDMDTESNVIPCIRAMVTSSTSLKVGTLYLITCNGSTIGSGDQCDIHIEEDDVTEKHATITYNQEQRNYFVTDLGSETGTTLNSTTENNPGTRTVIATPVTHKSILLIGTCIFVLHLHLGYETCDDCEPGQIQALLGHDQPTETVHALSKQDKEAIRRSELKSIKKKYDLHKEQYKQNDVFIGPRYNDRAAERRRTVGSDNPYEKDEMPTSYETELADHNKGHQMLKKMGWSKGKSLGKSQKGITEPIVPQGSGRGKLGLGFGVFRADGT